MDKTEGLKLKSINMRIGILYVCTEKTCKDTE